MNKRYIVSLDWDVRKVQTDDNFDEIIVLPVENRDEIEISTDENGRKKCTVKKGKWGACVETDASTAFRYDFTNKDNWVPYGISSVGACVNYYGYKPSEYIVGITEGESIIPTCGSKLKRILILKKIST